MKILQVTPGYYPRIGGVEYVVKSISERLVKSGHEVTVLAGEPGVDKPREEVVNSVRVIRWPTWSPSGAYHFPRKRSDLEELLKGLARQVDVVHVHSVHNVFAVHSSLLIASNTGSLKVVVTPHYHGTGHSFIRRILWIPWRRRVAGLLKRASVVHAVSRREASILASHYPEARDKIIVIPNGIDEDVFDYRWRGQNSYYMIYAGRVEKYKRLELGIEVARELNLKLLIVGKGPYRDKLVRYANKVYGEGVEFLEPQPRQKYLELLSKARYAINPSKHEAYSIFTAEALAMGTPAIVSKEISENLEAQKESFIKSLVIAKKAPIKTWSEVIQKYLRMLY